LKPERWGTPLVQEKYEEEKSCDRGNSSSSGSGSGGGGGGGGSNNNLLTG